MKVGVLALQGDVREHLAALRRGGAAAEPVRTPEELEAVDAIVLPGGESTTIGLLASSGGLMEPLRKRLAEGMPAYGTCAGLILLAREVRGGEVPHLGVLDVACHRNAYGRQVDSFEEDVEVASLGRVRAVFIRAPVIEEAGPGVEVLAELGGRPVMVRQGRILASTFHPELTDDPRIHRFFLDEICR